MLCPRNPGECSDKVKRRWRVVYDAVLVNVEGSVAVTDAELGFLRALAEKRRILC